MGRCEGCRTHPEGTDPDTPVPTTTNSGVSMARYILPRLFALSLLLGLVIGAAPARANLLPPTTVSLPVRVPTMGNYVIGTGQMAVTYTDTEATGIATAPSVGLGPNNVFRVDTCIKAH